MNKNIDTLIKRLDNDFVRCCKCEEYCLKKECTQYLYIPHPNKGKQANGYNDYECKFCSNSQINMRKMFTSDKVIAKGRIIKNRFGPTN